jgi:hypothetical protein
MKLPKFLLGDNTDFEDDIFIIHLDFPRFIVNLKDDDIEIIDDTSELSDEELNNEIHDLVLEASDFYDREVKRYEE